MSAFLTCPFLYCITLFFILMYCLNFVLYKIFRVVIFFNKTFILFSFFTLFYSNLHQFFFLYFSLHFSVPLFLCSLLSSPSPSSANGRRFLLEYERLIKDAYPVSNVQNSSYRTGKYITLFPFKRVFVVCQI
jgi:hypothetical protein